jgi:radical SAM protein with 4Fe4S-binding SPASM domain
MHLKAMKYGKTPFVPRLIFWESTGACNLRCRHCRRNDTDGTLLADELSTQEVRRWLEELRTWCRPLLIVSGGEALLRTDIFHVLNFAARLGLHTAVSTNGTLLTRERVVKLKKAGVRRVSVSLDGNRAGTHDAMRGVAGVFEAAVEGLGLLRRAGLNTQINMTVCRSNRKEVDGLFRMAEEAGVNAVHLFLFIPVGYGKTYGEKEALSGAEVERLMEWFYSNRPRSGMQARLTCVPQYQRFLARKGMLGATEAPVGCLAAKSICFVSRTGAVYPCGYYPVSAGTIRVTPFKDIWERSELFRALRDPDALEAPCGVCAYKMVCGGCRARAYAVAGRHGAGDTSCLYGEKLKKKTAGR